jgi:thiosulfate dehydrogenase [quinone] large subunit
MRAPWDERLTAPGWVLLPLRGFLAFVYLYGGISKVAGGTFLSGVGPQSMHASVIAARDTSPIGGLLGPVASHSFGFGLLMAMAELAVGIGLLLGLFTRVAAVGGMALSLSLWLTVSWQADPWFTSADLVYLFAFTPLLLAGAGGVASLDGWLDGVRHRQPGDREDRTRRALVAGGVAVLAGVVLGGAALFRRSPTNSKASAIDSAMPPVTLTKVAKVPVGGAVKVADGNSGHDAWVLQLHPGQITALSAVCPHEGCTVDFISPAEGFVCPCHQSHFAASGQRLSGPAPTGLQQIPVLIADGDVRTTSSS